MRERYESISLIDLRAMAKNRGMKGVTSLKKDELVEAMLQKDVEDAKEKEMAAPAPKVEAPAKEETQEAAPEVKNAESDIDLTLDSGVSVTGILEIMPDGFGFIRSANFLPGENDIYVSPAQIRKLGLRTGDILTGNTRIKTEREKFAALLYLTGINGMPVSEGQKRFNFDKMTPIFPNERIVLERRGEVSMRIMDLVCPVGKGQRGMIVSPPKAGKTTLLKSVAKSIKHSNPDMHMIILLIDERPEEVTDIKEEVEGPNVEVIYSTFDETAEHHKRVAEMVIERARRMVEYKKDVVILLDSITRLTRAYNQVVQPSGRTLSGGLDPAALHMPKRFFGAARNMREGGSLTILATALVETGSKMDDVVYEEFKGTGNMEMVLDRKLSERRVFPAIDLMKSSTRREDLLLPKDELAVMNAIRKKFNGLRPEDQADMVVEMFKNTDTNVEFVRQAEKRFL
ncbi:MAG: transcription termination factor Rho [Lachnospiraceae bacterium]|nr:transcription termination factor Rho [Lachnospiraceae bacterium]